MKRLLVLVATTAALTVGSIQSPHPVAAADECCFAHPVAVSVMVDPEALLRLPTDAPRASRLASTAADDPALPMIVGGALALLGTAGTLLAGARRRKRA